MSHLFGRKLSMINNAQNMNDLSVTPANQLEKLARNVKNYDNIGMNN